MRVLWFLLLGVIALAWLRTRGGADAEADRDPGRSRSAPGTPPPAPEPMVACAHCGVHLPAADSLREGAHHYCSEGHRQLGARSGA